MAKKAKSREAQAIRRAQREAYVAALREGRRERAATFTDRRREASRKACRGPIRD